MTTEPTAGKPGEKLRKAVARIDVGGGAKMAIPTPTGLWQQRYSDSCVRNRYEMASALDSYVYLVLECTKEEAWRRIKIMREAMKTKDIQP